MRVRVYAAGKRAINFHERRLSISKLKSPTVSPLLSASFPQSRCSFSEIHPYPPALQEPQEGVFFCFILEGTWLCVALRRIMPAERAGAGTGPTGSKPATASALWESSHEHNGHGRLRGATSAEKEGQARQPGSSRFSPHHCLSLDPGTQTGTVLDHSGA